MKEEKLIRWEWELIQAFKALPDNVKHELINEAWKLLARNGMQPIHYHEHNETGCEVLDVAVQSI